MGRKARVYYSDTDPFDLSIDEVLSYEPECYETTIKYSTLYDLPYFRRCYGDKEHLQEEIKLRLDAEDWLMLSLLSMALHKWSDYDYCIVDIS